MGHNSQRAIGSPLKTVPMANTLPPFRMFAEIVRAFGRMERVNNRELCDAIQQEPSITARLLGMANSSYYATGHCASDIRSIEQAVMRLGVQRVQSLLLSLVLRQRFSSHRCPAFEARRYWLDAMRVAHASLPVARTLGREDLFSHCFTVGLLHSIGMLLLVEQDPDGMNKIMQQPDKTSAIREHYGADQYAIGRRLLDHWGLPGGVSSAIEQVGSAPDAHPDAWTVFLTKALVDHWYNGAPLHDQASRLANDQKLRNACDDIQCEMLDTVTLLVV